MLSELYIENLAVIERLNVQLGEGFTVFTGETGAGKSIVIDALNLVLGQRINREMVRTGAAKAHVTAVFEQIPVRVHRRLSELGFETEESRLLISREIAADGRSQTRLMGRPVTVSALKEIGAMLINIHGQHDNQVLLQSSRHIDILDVYANALPLLTAYQTAYQTFTELKTRLQRLTMDEQQKARALEMLTYQIEEIDKADPKLGEEEALEQRVSAMRGADRIAASLSTVYGLLAGSDQLSGALDAVVQGCTLMQPLEGMLKPIDAITEKLVETRYELEDISEKIYDFVEKFEFDPLELDECEKRLDELTKLKRKYGASMHEVLAFREDAQVQLEQIQMSQQQKEDWTAQLQQAKADVIAAGTRLSEARKKAAQAFVTQTSEQLAFLDMPNITMKVQIEKGKYGLRGCDVVEILFSTNQGEEMRSISKIASGGELSRVMLAVKSVLARNDEIDTLIFDEIDVGVSGQSSQKIGLKLREVARHRQVLCVTHSAQIAALSQTHFLICKQTEQQRTYTTVTELCGEQKVREVARIMSTGEITPLLLKNARAMVEAGTSSPTVTAAD